MSASIGNILQQEREHRGLTLAQAADALHIREERLRELETDDFSNFPNPAYARMYFRLYCKYLDIKLTDEIDLLFPGALAGLDDYEYLRNEPVEPAKRTPRPKRPNKSLPVIAGMVLVVAIVGFMIWMSFVWTVQRLGGFTTKVISDASTLVDEKMQQAREQFDVIMPDAQTPQALDPEAPDVGVPVAPPAPTPEITAAGAPAEPLPVPVEVGLIQETPGETAAVMESLEGPAMVASEDGTEPEVEGGEGAADAAPPEEGGSTPPTEGATMPEATAPEAPADPAAAAAPEAAETAAEPAAAAEEAPPAEPEKPKEPELAFPD